MFIIILQAFGHKDLFFSREALKAYIIQKFNNQSLHRLGIQRERERDRKRGWKHHYHGLYQCLTSWAVECKGAWPTPTAQDHSTFVWLIPKGPWETCFEVKRLLCACGFCSVSCKLEGGDNYKRHQDIILNYSSRNITAQSKLGSACTDHLTTIETKEPLNAYHLLPLQTELHKHSSLEIGSFQVWREQEL